MEERKWVRARKEKMRAACRASSLIDSPDMPRSLTAFLCPLKRGISFRLKGGTFFLPPPPSSSSSLPRFFQSPLQSACGRCQNGEKLKN